jgi:hypothetical protein
MVVVRHESDLAGAHRGTTARDLPEDLTPRGYTRALAARRALL